MISVEKLPWNRWPEQVPENAEHLFRYEDPVDLDLVDEPRPDLRAYRIVSRTPKGVWIAVDYLERKFVLNEARKRFAYPTRWEAFESYEARKNHHAGWLKLRLRKVEAMRAWCNNHRLEHELAGERIEKARLDHWPENDDEE